jgi:putative lipoic acid-binding regulatory protein
MTVGNSGNEETGADEEPIVESVVRMDDGGSDLTNRFKYKVNALMGVFDPQTGVDDENQSGNILNALLTFPVRYSFNVVGRTSGDDKLKDEYINQVKDIVASLSGDGDRMEVRITPRGQNFTRVTLQVTVESVSIINSIYDALEKSNKTVMQY